MRFTPSKKTMTNEPSLFDIPPDEKMKVPGCKPRCKNGDLIRGTKVWGNPVCERNVWTCRSCGYIYGRP